MKFKLMVLFFTIILSTTARSMIIRHDVNPDLYLANENEYPAVFPVHINDKRKECVATLIAPRWAITAGHCTVLINLTGKQPHQLLINNQHYAVKSVHIHPEFGEVKGLRDENDQLIDMILNPTNMSYDVALIELSQYVNGVKPIGLYTLKNEVNQEILMLGWGDFTNGKSGTIRDQPVNDGHFRKAYNFIDGIDDNYLAFTFDPPESSKTHELEGVNGPGDSGGPALILKDKKLLIAGVSSRGYYPDDVADYELEGKYGWTENYVRISTIISWIKKVIGQKAANANAINSFKQYVGDYVYEPAGITITVFTRDDHTKLFTSVPGQEPYELKAVGKDTFVFKTDEAFKLEFKNAENGVFKEVTAFQPHGTITAVRNVKPEIDDLSTIDKKLTDKGFSGVVLVAQNENIIFHKAYGRKNNQNNGFNDINTVFDIGSITKQFTAAGILKLSMQNKISTSDKLSKYFEAVPRDKGSITIHQLLTHSSGLISDVGSDYETITEKDFLNRVFNSPLVSQIGEKFNYSNVGYSLLGLIVEKASGMDYETFLNVEFFKPLKMNHTGYVIPTWKKNEVANGFTNEVEAKKPNEENWSNQGPYLNLKANGGLLTRASDLLLWSQAIQKNAVFDKPTTFEFLFPHFQADDFIYNHYGYGWGVENNDSDEKLILHGGTSEFFATDLWIYPDKNITIIVLSNKSEEYVYSIARKISKTLLEM